MIKSLIISVVTLIASTAFGGAAGPYIHDASTLHHYHFDGHGLDAVPAGRIDLTLINGADAAAASYPGFNTALDTYDGTANDAASPAAVAPENMALSHFTGSNGSFTFEAIVRPDVAITEIPNSMQIISGEGDNSSDRGWQFRVSTAGRLEFIYLTGATVSYSWSLPTTGDHAWSPGEWYHVAVTYNGQEDTEANLKFYWTALDVSGSQAIEAASFRMPNDLIGTIPIDFAVGCDGRANNGYNENFEGLIDEVRISSIARLPAAMLVTSETRCPVIVSHPVDTFVRQSETAELQVVFESASAPSAQWYKAAAPLDVPLNPSDPDISVTVTYDSQSQAYTSVLSITNTSDSDAGYYYCRLDNLDELQRDSRLAELKILNLVARWSLDQADFVGNEYLDIIGGHHAAAYGSPAFTTGADGQAGGAVRVDAQNGWAAVPAFDTVGGSGQLTVSLWANGMDGSTARQDLLVSRYDQSGDMTAVDGLRSDTKWQHVCAVFDGSAGTVYIDGGLYARGNWTLPEETMAILNIGSDSEGGKPFQGALDDIRIYNYALDGSEVAALYTATSGRTPKGVLRQWWLNTGDTTQVSDLTNDPRYPDSPDGWEYIGRLEGPIDWAEYYGTRIRGYLIPPETGTYTFWIAGDDNSELWLSSNALAENAVRIAHVPGWTSLYQWDKYPEQQSAAVSLSAGHKYYMELLHKEGHGGDNLAVAWQGPGIEQTIIDGASLTVWKDFLRGDAYPDGTVNLLDAGVYSRQWLDVDCRQPVTVDLNGDCAVDMNDLILMAANWLQSE